MSAGAVQERPDTEEMVVIHRIFRRGFTDIAELVRGVPSGDTQWAAAVAQHLEFLLDGLHHHHTSEDEHLWPRLLERAEPDARLIERMSEQHEVVARHVQHLRGVLAGWCAAPSGSSLADGLDEFTVALTAHLDEEEREVCPLIEAHITVAEWQRMGDASFARFTNAQKLTALGQMLDVASPAEAAVFLGQLPPQVRLIWRLVGSRRYARYMAAVTGAARRA